MRSISETRGVWLPLTVLVGLLLVLWAAEPPQAYNAPVLLAILNILFGTGVSLFVTGVAGHSFLLNGRVGALLLASGMLAWGTGSFVAVTAFAPTPNFTVTVHNISVWLAAACHLVGALWERPQPVTRQRGWWLAAGFGASLGGVLLAVWGATAGWLPAFFVQGEGGTPVRQVVLGTAIAMLAATAALLWRRQAQSGSTFLRWYALGLGLIGAGLAGVLVQTVYGGVLGWTARGTQFLGGVYLLVAALVALRERDARGLALELALRQSQERYRQLLAVLPAAVYACDAAGRISFFNDQAAQLWGRRPQVGDADQRFCGALRLWLPDGRALPHAETPMAVAIQTGKSFRNQELIIERPDGSRVAVLVNIDPLRDADGKIAGAINAFIDISARHQAEEQVQQLNATLEQRVQSRTAELESANLELEAFSYSVSHDLRAPLRGLDGFSRILLQDYGGQLDPTGQDYLRRIRAAAQRMDQLIDDLLRLSRLTRADMRRRPVELSGLVERIAEELRQANPERVVSWQVARTLTVEADVELMEVALRNLIGNAWKFTARRAEARIEFGCHPGAVATPAGPVPGPVYYVRDNGVGFDMAQAGKLFGPFQRLHGQSEFAGNGVGLAIVQRVIHRHGGRVWAQAQPDAGASFLFTVPAAEPTRMESA